MGCVKHFLGLRWGRHAWDRRVTFAEDQYLTGTDMWGRSVPVAQALCHTQFVCTKCGTVRDDGDCFCEKAEADACAIRLAWLAEHPAQDQDAHPSSAST